MIKSKVRIIFKNNSSRKILVVTLAILFLLTVTSVAILINRRTSEQVSTFPNSISPSASVTPIQTGTSETIVPTSAVTQTSKPTQTPVPKKYEYANGTTCKNKFVQFECPKGAKYYVLTSYETFLGLYDFELVTNAYKISTSEFLGGLMSLTYDTSRPLKIIQDADGVEENLKKVPIIFQVSDKLYVLYFEFGLEENNYAPVMYFGTREGKKYHLQRNANMFVYDPKIYKMPDLLSIQSIFLYSDERVVGVDFLKPLTIDIAKSFAGELKTLFSSYRILQPAEKITAERLSSSLKETLGVKVVIPENYEIYYQPRVGDQFLDIRSEDGYLRIEVSETEDNDYSSPCGSYVCVSTKNYESGGISFTEYEYIEASVTNRIIIGNAKTRNEQYLRVSVDVNAEDKDGVIFKELQEISKNIQLVE